MAFTTMAKASSLKPLVFVLFVSMLIVSFFRSGQAQISCDTVKNDLSPCIGFIMNGGKVSPACCSGLNTLLSLAKTRTDRQSACSCLKSVVESATDDQLKNAAQIPHSCGVNLPFKISRDVDCSKVELA